MDTPLPLNQDLLEYSAAVPWQDIEQQKRKFNQAIKSLATQAPEAALPLEELSKAVGVPVTTVADTADTNSANVVLAESGGRKYVLASAINARYRGKKTFLQSLIPYNFNPSVNHTNLHETDDPTTQMRSLGAEIELGLLNTDGTPPTEEQMQEYMGLYRDHAQRLGISPHMDREVCQYQVEAHVAPVVGYQKTRAALHGIMTALAASSRKTGLLTAILSSYPTDSAFVSTNDPKVQTAVELMELVNRDFPAYPRFLAEVQARYHVPAGTYAQMFRLQGCHIHLDLAGRSEALGLFAFHTMLRSATAIANAAVLKGGPFVNGTCDPELLCTREYLRRTTVTGRYLELPTSPHLSPHGLERYSTVLRSERVNAPGRAMLIEDGLGSMVSAMHNPIGRVRPDLPMSKRICTLESTGMPASISGARMAAILVDFEYSHVIIEDYFRKYGCDLEPMFNNREMWAVLGPLDQELYIRLQDTSDRECTDLVLTTATGQQMTLAEFYEMKRIFMHKALLDVESVNVTPRDIDDVYVSLERMLAPPSGKSAQTITQFVSDPKLRSTGNWGRILRNAFMAAGGVLGQHQPEIVLRVVNEINEALCKRYLDYC